jgi:hypothetical protein
MPCECIDLHIVCPSICLHAVNTVYHFTYCVNIYVFMKRQCTGLHAVSVYVFMLCQCVGLHAMLVLYLCLSVLPVSISVFCSNLSLTTTILTGGFSDFLYFPSQILGNYLDNITTTSFCILSTSSFILQSIQ